jgi:hypothetical protein
MKFRSCLAAALLLAACSDDGSNLPTETPRYAVMFEVYDDVGSNSYLALLPSLDGSTVDVATSREFAGGRAFLASYNGWIFVGDPTSPTVTRFSVDGEGKLAEEGTVSFANYGLTSGLIDPWTLTFVSATKAYMFELGSGTYIIFDPTTMEITGEIAAPASFTREGMTIDGSPPAVRGNRLYRSIFWANYDTAEYSQDQLLAVYDLDNDRLLETIAETRCPNPGNLTQTDEAGNIYFSNWIWPVAGTLMHERAKNCVLRIPPGSDRFDPNWSLDYAAMSGGHEGAMFSYFADGKGVVSIFDETRTSFDAETDPWEYAGSANWQVWNVDVTAKTGAPINGIPFSAGAYTPLHFEDRSFVMIPNSDWSETRLYEIDGADATPGLSIPGWSYMFVGLE